jgi:hypothetical protein
MTGEPEERSVVAGRGHALELREHEQTPDA